MMDVPPRFIVVDDKPEHLAAILSVFQTLGTSCLGIVYDAEQGLKARDFRGVRVLFLDLHLIDPLQAAGEERHFVTVASILQDCISQSGGPFVLVVWTEHDHLIDGLREYLDASLDPERPHARPLAIVGLSKGNFIDVNTGVANEGRADALRDAIEAEVRGQPQLAALMAWEIEVLAAAATTLSTLVDLVPNEMRNSTSFGGALDEVLSRLAREAVGRQHVATDHRAAIATALAPILADRIVNQDVSETAAAVWRQAVTWGGRERLDSRRAGKVNRMLHVAVPRSEAIQSTDWGAVVEYPAAWWTNNEIRNRLGVTQAELLGQEFKIGTDDRVRCRPRLVRIGAACDHAQGSGGPLPYLFGLEIPCDVQRKPDNTGEVRLPASEWSSPTLLLDEASGPFVLAVNTRYALSVTPATADGWQPVYRLREQLLMHLISHASGYMARPGIVSF